MATSPFIDTPEFARSLTNGDDVDSDSVDLAAPAYGFHVGVTGSVKFNDLAGNTHVIPVVSGKFYEIGVGRLWTNGHSTLTAADIWLAR